MTKDSDSDKTELDSRKFLPGPNNSSTVSTVHKDKRLQKVLSRFDELLKDLSEFSAVEKYEVIRQLGHGRQGVVLEVLRNMEYGCRTRHALKVFNPNWCDSHEEYDSDLQRIATQAGRLQQTYHPNLVHNEAFYLHKGCGIKLMELIDGITLVGLVRERARKALADNMADDEFADVNEAIFSPDGAVQPALGFYILRKILHGLAALHNVGYIHCDIKPDNIMLDRFGIVKIIDFGRAVEVSGEQDIFMGSPMYMAPEVLDLMSVTPLSDLYSTGFVILELLHGKQIISRDMPREEILAFKATLPERITEFLPARVKENAPLAAVLRRLLAVNPNNRFNSAEEADASSGGARDIHRQLALADFVEADYHQDLMRYVSLRVESDAKLDGITRYSD